MENPYSSRNNPYCSEAWQPWQALQPILEHIEQFFNTGIVSDEMAAQFPKALKGLERMLRSDS